MQDVEGGPGTAAVAIQGRRGEGAASTATHGRGIRPCTCGCVNRPGFIVPACEEGPAGGETLWSRLARKLWQDSFALVTPSSPAGVRRRGPGRGGQQQPQRGQVCFPGVYPEDGVVAIVGGGLSGLTCALELAKLGVRSVVFDTGRRLLAVVPESQLCVQTASCVTRRLGAACCTVGLSPAERALRWLVLRCRRAWSWGPAGDTVRAGWLAARGASWGARPGV